MGQDKDSMRGEAAELRTVVSDLEREKDKAVAEREVRVFEAPTRVTWVCTFSRHVLLS